MNTIKIFLSRVGLFILGIFGTTQVTLAATPPSPSVPKFRSSQSEVVSEFDIEGQHFLLLWKPGLCLLRTVESYGQPDAVQYTAADLFVQLYDGTPDYVLSKEKAVAQAPLIAKKLILDQRNQEMQMMEQLYTSPDMQRDYPVYQVWQQTVKGTIYPAIWASHNAGLFVKLNGQWRVAGFANSRQEAESKVGAMVAP